MIKRILALALAGCLTLESASLTVYAAEPQTQTVSDNEITELEETESTSVDEVQDIPEEETESTLVDEVQDVPEDGTEATLEETEASTEGIEETTGGEDISPESDSLEEASSEEAEPEETEEEIAEPVAGSIGLGATTRSVYSTSSTSTTEDTRQVSVEVAEGYTTASLNISTSGNTSGETFFVHTFYRKKEDTEWIYHDLEMMVGSKETETGSDTLTGLEKGATYEYAAIISDSSSSSGHDPDTITGSLKASGEFTTLEETRQVSADATAVGLTSATISVSTSGNTSGLAFYVHTFYRQQDTTGWIYGEYSSISGSEETGTASFGFNSLERATVYEYAVVITDSRSSDGLDPDTIIGDIKASGEFTTLEEDTRQVGTDVAEVDCTTASFNISTSGNETGQSFYVHTFYRKQDTVDWRYKGYSSISGSEETGTASQTFTRLDPGTTYEYAVVITDSSSSSGLDPDTITGSLKASGEFTTLADPRQVNAKVTVYYTSATVRIETSGNHLIDIDYYFVHTFYRKKGDTDWIHAGDQYISGGTQGGTATASQTITGLEEEAAIYEYVVVIHKGSSSSGLDPDTITGSLKASGEFGILKETRKVSAEVNAGYTAASVRITTEGNTTGEAFYVHTFYRQKEDTGWIYGGYSSISGSEETGTASVSITGLEGNTAYAYAVVIADSNTSDGLNPDNVTAEGLKASGEFSTSEKDTRQVSVEVAEGYTTASLGISTSGNTSGAAFYVHTFYRKKEDVDWIYVNGNSISGSEETGAASQTISNLELGTTYAYAVLITDSDSSTGLNPDNVTEEGIKASGEFTTMEDTRQVSASVVTGYITADFSISTSGNQTGIDFYVHTLYRKKGVDEWIYSGYNSIGSSGETGTASQTLTGLETGTTYEYAVVIADSSDSDSLDPDSIPKSLKTSGEFTTLAEPRRISVSVAEGYTSAKFTVNTSGNKLGTDIYVQIWSREKGTDSWDWTSYLSMGSAEASTASTGLNYERETTYEYAVVITDGRYERPQPDTITGNLKAVGEFTTLVETRQVSASITEGYTKAEFSMHTSGNQSGSSFYVHTFYRKKETADWLYGGYGLIFSTAETGTASLTLTGLETGTTYEYAMVISSIGSYYNLDPDTITGIHMTVGEFTTLEEDTRQIDKVSVTEGYTTASFTIFTSGNQSGSSFYIHTFYRKKEAAGWTHGKRWMVSDTSITGEITGLEMATTYEYAVVIADSGSSSGLDPDSITGGLKAVGEFITLTDTRQVSAVVTAGHTTAKLDISTSGNKLREDFYVHTFYREKETADWTWGGYKSISGSAETGTRSQNLTGLEGNTTYEYAVMISGSNSSSGLNPDNVTGGGLKTSGTFITLEEEPRQIGVDTAVGYTAAQLGITTSGNVTGEAFYVHTFYRKEGDAGWTWKNYHYIAGGGETGTASESLTGLEKNTAYEYAVVIAESNSSKGLDPETVTEGLKTSGEFTTLAESRQVSVNTTEVGGTSASIRITTSGNKADEDFYVHTLYRKKETANWVYAYGANISGSEETGTADVIIAGLEENTAYEYAVVITGSSDSNGLNPDNVTEEGIKASGEFTTTLEEETRRVSIEVTEKDYTSVKINITKEEGVAFYVHTFYRKKGAAGWTYKGYNSISGSAETSTASQTLTNLKVGTTYEYAVVITDNSSSSDLNPDSVTESLKTSGEFSTLEDPRQVSVSVTEGYNTAKFSINISGNVLGEYGFYVHIFYRKKGAADWISKNKNYIGTSSETAAASNSITDLELATTYEYAVVISDSSSSTDLDPDTITGGFKASGEFTTLEDLRQVSVRTAVGYTSAGIHSTISGNIGEPFYLHIFYRKQGDADWIYVDYSQINSNVETGTISDYITDLESGLTYEYAVVITGSSDSVDLDPDDITGNLKASGEFTTLAETRQVSTKVTKGYTTAKLSIETSGNTSGSSFSVQTFYRKKGAEDWIWKTATRITNLEGTHTNSVNLTDLEKETTYEYAVVIGGNDSSDPDSITGNLKSSGEFTTLAETRQVSTAETKVGRTSATISIETSGNISEFSFYVHTFYRKQNAADWIHGGYSSTGSAGTGTANVSLTDLEAGTAYEYAVVIADSSSSSGLDPDAITGSLKASGEFTTLEEDLRQVSVNETTAGRTSATINVTTSENRLLEDFYVHAFYRKQAEDSWTWGSCEKISGSEETATASLKLTGLELGTTYAYAVVITDSSDASGLDPDTITGDLKAGGEFTTLADTRQVNAEVSTAYTAVTVSVETSGNETGEDFYVHAFYRRQGASGWLHGGYNTISGSEKTSTNSLKVTGLGSGIAYEYAIVIADSSSSSGLDPDSITGGLKVVGEFTTLTEDPRQVSVTGIEAGRTTAAFAIATSGNQSSPNFYTHVFYRKKEDTDWIYGGYRTIQSNEETAAASLELTGLEENTTYAYAVVIADSNSRSNLNPDAITGSLKASGEFTTLADTRQVSAEVTARYTTASISISTSGNETGEGFYVHTFYRKREDIDWTYKGRNSIDGSTETGTGSKLLEGLEQGTTYEYAVVITNSSDSSTLDPDTITGGLKASGEFTTLEETRQVSAEVTATGYTTAALGIETSGNTSGESFYVHTFYRKKEAAGWTWVNDKRIAGTTETGETSQTITGLDMGTAYEYVVVITDSYSPSGLNPDTITGGLKASGEFTTLEEDSRQISAEVTARYTTASISISTSGNASGAGFYVHTFYRKKGMANWTHNGYNNISGSAETGTASQSLTGLELETTYEYAVVITSNSSSSTLDPDTITGNLKASGEFTTLAETRQVSAEVTAAGYTTASLGIETSGNKADGSFYVHTFYRKKEAAGWTHGGYNSISGGTETGTASQTLTGLELGTTYEYAVVITDSRSSSTLDPDTITGNLKSSGEFTTLAETRQVSAEVTAAGYTTASLGIETSGNKADGSFCVHTFYRKKEAAGWTHGGYNSISGGTETGTASQTLTGLELGTTYEYAVVITDSSSSDTIDPDTITTEGFKATGEFTTKTNGYTLNLQVEETRITDQEAVVLVTAEGSSEDELLEVVLTLSGNDTT